MNKLRGETPPAERDGKYYADALVSRVMDNVIKKGHMDELIANGINEFHSGSAAVNEEAKSLFKEMMISRLTDYVEYCMDLGSKNPAENA